MADFFITKLMDAPWSAEAVTSRKPLQRRKRQSLTRSRARSRGRKYTSPMSVVVG
jgi:hypothetical protein